MYTRHADHAHARDTNRSNQQVKPRIGFFQRPHYDRSMAAGPRICPLPTHAYCAYKPYRYASVPAVHAWSQENGWMLLGAWVCRVVAWMVSQKQRTLPPA